MPPATQPPQLKISPRDHFFSYLLRGAEPTVRIGAHYIKGANLCYWTSFQLESAITSNDVPSAILYLKHVNPDDIHRGKQIAVSLRLNRVDEEAVAFLKMALSRGEDLNMDYSVNAWVGNDVPGISIANGSYAYFVSEKSEVANFMTLQADTISYIERNLATNQITNKQKHVTELHAYVSHIMLAMRKTGWLWARKSRVAPYQEFVQYAIRLNNLLNGKISVDLRQERSAARTGVEGGCVLAAPNVKELVRCHFGRPKNKYHSVKTINIFNYNLRGLFEKYAIPYIRDPRFDQLYYGFDFSNLPVEHFLASRYIFDKVAALAIRRLLRSANREDFTDIYLAICQPNSEAYKDLCSVKFDYQKWREAMEKDPDSQTDGGFVKWYIGVTTPCAYHFPSDYYIKNRLKEVISAVIDPEEDKEATIPREGSCHPSTKPTTSARAIFDAKQNLCQLSSWESYHEQYKKSKLCAGLPIND